MRKFDVKEIWFIVLICITVIAVGVTIWALWFREPANLLLTPDYAPQETEKNVENIKNDEPKNEKMESSLGGGAVSLIYSKDVSIDLSDKTVSLMFGNPSKSNRNMVVQLVIQDQSIVQSGLIPSGNKVQTLELIEGTDEKLQVGGYDGKMVVFYYNPETGERDVLNTEILVTVTVTE